jgi:hypothetical protein
MIKNNYKVDRISDKLWGIYENKTEQYVMYFNHNMKAQGECSKLNKNKVGFHGWTPAFIAEGLCNKTR